MTLTEILKVLTEKRIGATISYDLELDQPFINLNTQAKSHLYLYNNGTIQGRYDFIYKVELNGVPQEEILRELCKQYSNALCGRPYGNDYWFDLCKEMGVECKTYQ